MATNPMAASPDSVRNEQSPVDAFQQALEWTLAPIASLKLTVALFACSIVIVLVGTLAQTEMTMWEVKNDFFETYIAWISFNVLMPKSFWPDRPDFTGGFYFPGGALIGLMLLLNLVAAHLVRFKIQAKGSQLMIGVIGMTIGTLITLFVILGGHNKAGIQGQPFFDWSTLWLMLKLSLVAFWFLAVYATVQLTIKTGPGATVELTMLVAVVGALTALIAFLLFKGDAAELDASSMRILWQLIQGTLCGVALLFGAAYLFKQRAGVVVMHLGVGLLMLSELLVSLTAVEQQMTIYEKETVNFARDIRTTELAFTTPGETADRQTVVPRWMLEQSARKHSKITHADLPVDMVVHDYLKNAELSDTKPGGDNPADTGAGKYLLAQGMRVTGGAEASSDVDFPSVYVEFFEKGTDNSLGVYLMSTLLSAQEYQDKVKTGDQEHLVSLRFRRDYKQYSVTLLDTERVNYEGTSQAQSYESQVRIEDKVRDNVIERERIWMNNPLRYAGETFYQSGHGFDNGREFSTLQIVSNFGWMIPYISCMIVAVGMFFHFGLTWRRFLGRRDRTQLDSPIDFLRTGGPLSWISALLIVTVLAGYLLSRKEKIPETNGMDLESFATLPVLYEGRTQPLDTLARNTLKIISDREYVELDAEQIGDDAKKKKVPAIVWLLDLLTEKTIPQEYAIYDNEKPREPLAQHYRIFRVDHPEIQRMLKLDRRKGHRYSVSEIIENFDKIEQLSKEARAKKDKSKLTVMERRGVELTRRTRAFMGLVVAFRAIDLPNIDYRNAIKKIQAGEELDEQTFAQLSLLRQAKDAADQQDAQLASSEPPLLIPTKEGKWQPYATAMHQNIFGAIVGQPSNPLAKTFDEILTAYQDEHGGVFNKKVAQYQSQLASVNVDNLSPEKLVRESEFNRQWMFTDAMVLYLLAFMMTPIAYLVVTYESSRSAGRRLSSGGAWLNRFAFLLIVAGFLIHTAALVIRMNLSGRPPVTNLYSSAIFIGWGGVLLGFAIELFFRIGIGNLGASVAGFSTLIIANILSGDGDTMKVLVAVLDTQFWLATHVVCITLGYTTTFLAGLVGVIFILGGVFTPAISPPIRKVVGRMIYAIVCFSIFFSFIGTVLGGLWADDSWGRFWGWDPKENGALMIVIWNALVLHARWGGMIKERGLAVLSVGGMIVTAWSWFGVNELGVGLHSYGFTDGVLFTLAIAVGLMMTVMAIGSLPNRLWFSNLVLRDQDEVQEKVRPA